MSGVGVLKPNPPPEERGYSVEEWALYIQGLRDGVRKNARGQGRLL